MGIFILDMTRLVPSSTCHWISRRSYSALAGRSYDDSINLLNSLQTPHRILEERRKANIRIDINANSELIKCLSVLGHEMHHLNSLNIIHVAGTKGKGTTCAFVDSILSQYRKVFRPNAKFGLYTSPHLVAVRERIRINSAPISPSLFAKYFFEVWDRLDAAGVEKPVYFRYLTLMSYHVFLKEKVNIAIYETGVGGEYDSTNIVERPAVTGITALGIDHTFTLGETIEEISWHKAGIQKSKVPSFTVAQPSKASGVIKTRAQEKKVTLVEVPSDDPRIKDVALSPDLAVQRMNASLAIPLAETALRKAFSIPAFSENLPDFVVNGLNEMSWPGRFQKIQNEKISWYLDGAHTADSIKVAIKWFLEDKTMMKPDAQARDILIFNQQGHRDAVLLLDVLFFEIKANNLKFSQVIFCTNAVDGSYAKGDFVNHTYDGDAVADLSTQYAFAARWKELQDSLSKTWGPDTDIHVLPSLTKAIDHVKSLPTEDGEHHNVLVTGSLHLVGAALDVLGSIDAQLHLK